MLQIQAKVDKYLHKALAEASGYVTAWLNQLSACNLGHSPFSVNTILPKWPKDSQIPNAKSSGQKASQPFPVPSTAKRQCRSVDYPWQKKQGEAVPRSTYFSCNIQGLVKYLLTTYQNHKNAESFWFTTSKLVCTIKGQTHLYKTSQWQEVISVSPLAQLPPATPGIILFTARWKCSILYRLVDQMIPRGTGTLPETNSLPLKIDHWKRRFLLETTIFRGYVSFRECSGW